MLSVSINVLAANVIVGQTEKTKYKYRIELATLILEKTVAQYGPAKIVPFSRKDPTQSRCLRLLSTKEIDVAYLPATEDILK